MERFQFVNTYEIREWSALVAAKASWNSKIIIPYRSVKNTANTLLLIHHKIVILLSNVLENSIFLNCYLAAPWPNLGHCWGGSLTHLMLITVFVEFWLGTMYWGWIPKLGEAPSGVWTEYHLILIAMPVLTRLLSPVLTELNCNFFWWSLPVQSFHNSHLANLNQYLDACKVEASLSWFLSHICFVYIEKIRGNLMTGKNVSCSPLIFFPA